MLPIARYTLNLEYENDVSGTCELLSDKKLQNFSATLLPLNSIPRGSPIIYTALGLTVASTGMYHNFTAAIATGCPQTRPVPSAFASFFVSGRVNSVVDAGAFLDLKCRNFNDGVQLLPDVGSTFRTEYEWGMPFCGPNNVSLSIATYQVLFTGYFQR
jgi:hypothetical protein